MYYMKNPFDIDWWAVGLLAVIVLWLLLSIRK